MSALLRSPVLAIAALLLGLVVGAAILAPSPSEAAPPPKPPEEVLVVNTSAEAVPVDSTGGTLRDGYFEFIISPDQVDTIPLPENFVFTDLSFIAETVYCDAHVLHRGAYPGTTVWRGGSTIGDRETWTQSFTTGLLSGVGAERLHFTAVARAGSASGNYCVGNATWIGYDQP